MGTVEEEENKTKKPPQYAFPVANFFFFLLRGGMGTREALAEQEAGGNSTALNELFHGSARVAASFPLTAQGMRQPQKVSEVFLPPLFFFLRI